MSSGPTYEQHDRIPGTPYRVVRFLGAGGMGAVYEVEDTTIGKRYVLKTVHLAFVESAGSDTAARMLNQEARILAQVSHPNIVDVITAGRIADRYALPFLVMEKLDGVTLRSLLDKLFLPRRSIGQIANELLDALMHLHHPSDARAPMLHRDIKPENIFLARAREVDTKYTVKLLDLGIAVLLDGPSHGVHGTPLYMAPEQFRGEHLDERTDLYQAACVIFEMLAGRHPFRDAETLAEMSSAHLFQRAPRLSAFIDIETQIDDVIAAALAKDRNMRPRDARAFADGLAALRHQAMATNVGDHLRRALEDAKSDGYVAYATGRATTQTLSSADGRISSLMGVAMPSLPSPPPRADAPTPGTHEHSSRLHEAPRPAVVAPQASPLELVARPPSSTAAAPRGTAQTLAYVSVGLALASIVGAVAVVVPVLRSATPTPTQPASVLGPVPPHGPDDAADAHGSASRPNLSSEPPTAASAPTSPVKPVTIAAPSTRAGVRTRTTASPGASAAAVGSSAKTPDSAHRPDFLPLSLPTQESAPLAHPPPGANR